jgi:uncharacterized protein (TIGR00369 family)
MIEPKDPKPFIERFEKSDGLGRLFGAKILSLTETECTYEYETLSSHFNPYGILHGGTLYSIMDSSQGLLIHYLLESMDPSFKAAATGTATIKYLAPVRNGKIFIRTILKERQGRKVFMSSVAEDGSGNRLAELEEIWIAILR